MQFSPILKEKKTITIEECIKDIKLLSGNKLSNTISQLSEPQKRFLWCIANKY
jgi:hypothetical protein